MYIYFNEAREASKPQTTMTNLNLNKTCRGYYEKSVDGTTITVSNPSHVIGGKSDWQLTIDEGYEEYTVNEWFPTKRECYEFCVNWLINRPEGS